MSSRLDVVRDNGLMFPAVREVETYLRNAVAHSSDGIAREYQDRIAEITGYSSRQVRRAIVWLQAHRGLKSVRHHYSTRKPNDYFFVPENEPLTSSDVLTSSTLTINNAQTVSDVVIDEPMPRVRGRRTPEQRQQDAERLAMRVADDVRKAVGVGTRHAFNEMMRRWLNWRVLGGEFNRRLALALADELRRIGLVFNPLWQIQ